MKFIGNKCKYLNAYSNFKYYSSFYSKLMLVDNLNLTDSHFLHFKIEPLHFEFL